MKLGAHVNQVAESAIEKAMQTLPQKVESVIESSIYSLLGLSRSWSGGNKLEIDHCNGRWNLFAEVLKAEAKADVEKIVRNVKARMNVSEFTEAFQKEYMAHFRSYLKYEAQRYAKERAEAFVKGKIDKVVENLNNREMPKK